jgi:pimeloyl-ACP methyl ester carboxylesterase
MKELSGHGADLHHGRVSLGVVRALERLLALESVRAHSVFTEIDGLRLHHLELGAGPDLVVLHGASGGAGNWFRLLNGLSRERRVIALDLPGFGSSEGIAPEYPLGPQVARLVLRWLGAIGVDRFDVAATSFGGLIALRLAQHAPERVRRLGLVNSVGLGREVPWQLRVGSLPGFSGFTLKPSRRGIRWQFTNLMTSDRSGLPERHMEALLDYIWEVARAGNPDQLARAFGLFSNLRGQRELLSDEELRSLTTPTWLLWGARDRFLPVAHARRVADLVPSAQLCIIPRAGHSPNWEAPEAVLECLSSFLRPTLAP